MASYKIYLVPVSNTAKTYPKFIKFNDEEGKNTSLSFDELITEKNLKQEYFHYINNSFIPMGEELVIDLLNLYGDKTKNELWINYSANRLYG